MIDQTEARRGVCLMLVTGARVAPELLETAVARAHPDHERLHVVIPAVLPATLPISALPDRLAERVNALRRVAMEAFMRAGAHGRIEVVPTHDPRSALFASVVELPDHVVLVGAPSRSLRRAACGIAPVTLIGELHRDAPLRAVGVFSELLEAGRRTLRPMSLRTRYPAHTVPEAEGGLPRPAHALAPYAAILAASGLLALAHALPVRWAVALALAAALAGAAAAGWSWVQRTSLCDRADRWIAAGEGAAPPPAVVDQRRAELVRGRERRSLAASLQRIVAMSQKPWQRTAQVPIDRTAVRAERARLERLAALLADTDVPVPAREVARAHVLVTDPASPLYRGAAAGVAELRRQLIQTLFEIERGV